MGNECIEFAEASVIEERDQPLSRRELAALVLRFDSFFTAAEMGGFSSGLKLVQLRLLYLIFRRVGRRFGSYRDASQASDSLCASPQRLSILVAIVRHGAKRP